MAWHGSWKQAVEASISASVVVNIGKLTFWTNQDTLIAQILLIISILITIQGPFNGPFLAVLFPDFLVLIGCTFSYSFSANLLSAHCCAWQLWKEENGRNSFESEMDLSDYLAVACLLRCMECSKHIRPHIHSMLCASHWPELMFLHALWLPCCCSQKTSVWPLAWVPQPPTPATSALGRPSIVRLRQVEYVGWCRAGSAEQCLSQWWYVCTKCASHQSRRSAGLLFNQRIVSGSSIFDSWLDALLGASSKRALWSDLGHRFMSKFPSRTWA